MEKLVLIRHGSPHKKDQKLGHGEEKSVKKFADKLYKETRPNGQKITIITSPAPMATSIAKVISHFFHINFKQDELLQCKDTSIKGIITSKDKSIEATIDLIKVYMPQTDILILITYKWHLLALVRYFRTKVLNREIANPLNEFDPDSITRELECIKEYNELNSGRIDITVINCN